MVKINISATEFGETLKDVNAFRCSEEPPYLAIILPPSPGVWEDLMDQGYLHIKINTGNLEVKIKQRIEVGDSTIFFVTSDHEAFRKIVGE
jgi:hypothetical protein